MTIKCKLCGDVLIGDNKGTFMRCSCGQCYIDQTPYYVRIGGDPKNILKINREQVIKNILRGIKHNKRVIKKGCYYYRVAPKTVEKLLALKYNEYVIYHEEYYFKGDLSDV